MSQQFLSQDEVDALLEGADDEPAAEAVDDGQPIPYDLAKQERFVRGRMPTLEIVNERFARNLRIGLFNFMRRNPEISVGGVKVQKFGAFLRDIAMPANLNVVQVKPLRGNGLVICDPKLVFTMIEHMFGGDGRRPYRIEGRDFSPTESRLIQRMLEVVLDEYRKAWQGVYPLHLEYLRSETNPQFAEVATPSEIVVTTTFSIGIGEAGGELHICVPYATLEPIRDTLYSTVQGDALEVDRRWVGMLTQQIQTAEVELRADLATATATVGELMALRPGDFIELDLEESVIAHVDGVPVFECRYGTSNNRYAIRIQEVLTSPQKRRDPNDTQESHR